MTNWQKQLNSDVLPWLLEPENPAVRFWALIDILERPLNDAEVQAARAAIAQQSLVKKLFEGQHPTGYWGDDESKPYTAQGTLGVLSLLYMLGVPPDERTTMGCDSMLKFCQNEIGGFSLTKTRRSGVFPCTTGEHLPFLVYFGMQGDPRVQAAFAYVVADMRTEDALDCGRYQHQDCLWGAIAALNGLATLPTDKQSEQAKQVVIKLADRLLDTSYDFAGEHKRWLSFGVPRTWDLLSALKALVKHGYAQDRRFEPLLELFLQQQDNQGRWLCGSSSRTWPLEKRNQPSKWITLDALRVLKYVA